MATFKEFYNSLSSEPDKGKAFERFVKWFLKNDPVWSTHVDEIWLWDEYPDRWGADLGIDLIFKHKNGETWSVQAKCYDPDNSISKPDIDSFISESGGKTINKRLLIATTDRIGKNALGTLERNNVVHFLKSDFEHSAINYPSSLSELYKVKKKEKPKPDGDYQYQLEAIESVTNSFKDHDRCRLVMACGTGKSYISLWIKEHLSAKRTLVLVPSLGLLSQLLHDWTFTNSSPFEILCVCSDKTVGKKNYDEMIHSSSDLAFPVTSDVNEIKQFLMSDKNQVIFSTYQSSPLVAEAQSDKSIPEFDFVVADEAHRCAGKVDSAFSAVLDGNLIRARKRLFATATPRIYSSSVKKKAEERGVEVASMDDEEIFGKVAHTLSFSEAISLGRLTDYKVVIIGVDDQMISEWIQNRELVGTDTEINTDAQSLASMIGLIKAINDYDLRRIISFHNRIINAVTMNSEIKEVLQWMKHENRPQGNLWGEHIDGKMPTSDRNKILKRLKELKTDERGIVSNARCLSEGVDVPALDGIAFFDPRRSQIDIIQAVGRAMRLSEEKKFGIIFIPVFIENGEDPVSRIEASNFKPVWDIINALKAHDDALSEELDQYRTQLGRKSRSIISSFSTNKIVFDLPRNIDQTFANNLKTILVERTTESWMFWYGLLEKYVNEHGHSRVSQGDKTEDGFALGKG
ncbi:MAG: DEAD/DEAH box helicase family protein [Proteobacteria bacterium]|nr:DEAD/DEAH box helicase family protein [Pseudomonadota bacterium]